MNYTAEQRRKLWGILVSLALAITVAIVLDCLPVVDKMPSDVLESVGTTADSTEDIGTSTDTPDTVVTEPDTTAPEQSTDTQETPAEDTSFVLTFLGECAPGSPLGTSSFGSLNALTKNNGTEYYFSQLQSVLSFDDLTVATNTCVFTDNHSTNSLAACAAPATSANIYSAGSVEFLSLAAPSLNEYTSESLSDTKDSLDMISLRYAEDGQISYFENAGIRAAIVCLQLTKNLNTAADTAIIREAKESAEYVIVYFWGGDNDSHTPEEWLTATLRSFADAGASLIVGCGNGVLRPVEKYNNATIAYSLGVFIDGSSMYHENATALLQLTITKDETDSLTESIQLIPCYAYNEIWQPCLVTDPTDAQSITAFLYGEAVSPTEY